MIYGQFNGSYYPQYNGYYYHLNALDYLSSENMGLKNALGNAQYTINNLNNTIASLMKRDVLREEELFDNDHSLLCRSRRNDSNNDSYILYADWKIDRVYLREYDKLYNKPNTIVAVVGNIEVNIPIKDFNKRKILHYFEEKGLSVKMKASSERRELLLVGYIATHFLKQPPIQYIPYCNGWSRDSTRELYYILQFENINNLNSPAYKNRLKISNTNEPIKSCEKFLRTLNVFKRRSDKVLVLGVLSYSLIYTLLREKNIEMKQIILISGDKEPVKKVVDFFFNIFDHDGYISLNQKNADIQKEIVSTKDNPLVFEARGCDFGDYKPKRNLDFIEDAVCYGSCISVDDIQINTQSPIIVLNNELGYTLDPSLFFEIEVHYEYIDTRILNRLYTFKERMGATIMNFLKYASKVNFSHIIHEIDLTGVRDIYEDSYKALAIALKTLENFMYECYELNINDFIGGKFYWNDVLKPFFNKDIEDMKCITGLFIDILHELIDKGELSEKYDRNLSDQYDLDKIIFIIDDEVYIRRSIIDQYIVPCMNVHISGNKVMEYLKRENMLVLNRNGYECKRVINYADGSKRQVSFVILKRFNYRMEKDCDLTKGGNAHEADSWNVWDGIKDFE